MKKKRAILSMIFITILLVGASLMKINKNSHNLQNAEQTISGTEFSGKAELFRGEETIWAYASESTRDIPMGYLFTVRKGSIRLVHITPDGSAKDILSLFGNIASSEMKYTDIHLGEGKNLIKIIADKDTQFEWKINIEEGAFKKLGE